MRQYLRKDLQDFKPYPVEPEGYRYKMDANESPFAMTPKVKAAFLKWVEEDENLNCYPETNSTLLREKIAETWGVDKENIVCGVGSDQLIEYIAKMLLEPGECMVVPAPSFSMYRLTAALNHGRVVEIPLTKETDSFTYDLERMGLAAKENAAKAIIICTPNNPTGGSVPVSEIKKLLESVECPVIVDEAYGEFNKESAVSLIKSCSNLLVLKTFSKAYGAAGIRLGYAVGSKEMVDLIETVRGPYNLSTLSQVIGMALLDDRDAYQERVQFLIKERRRLFDALKKQEGFVPFQSDANFIYIESEKDIAALLKEKSILVRSFGKTPEGRYAARVSVGSEETNDAFIKAIGEL